MTIRAPAAVIDFDDHFKSVLAKDLARMVVGDRLGTGVARDVFVSKFDDACVLKLEDITESFQNINEWHAWNDICETKWAKWFAPCCSISSCGLILIQKRTQPITEKKDLPKRVPSFLTDLKKANWGMFEGRPVCHDYGTLPIVYGKAAVMVKPEWWDG